jgi:hypothetical protein
MGGASAGDQRGGWRVGGDGDLGNKIKGKKENNNY